MFSGRATVMPNLCLRFWKALTAAQDLRVNVKGGHPMQAAECAIIIRLSCNGEGGWQTDIS